MLALFPIVDWKREKNDLKENQNLFELILVIIATFFMALLGSGYKIWNEMENNFR